MDSISRVVVSLEGGQNISLINSDEAESGPVEKGLNPGKCHDDKVSEVKNSNAGDDKTADDEVCEWLDGGNEEEEERISLGLIVTSVFDKVAIDSDDGVEEQGRSSFDAKSGDLDSKGVDEGGVLNSGNDGMGFDKDSGGTAETNAEIHAYPSIIVSQHIGATCKRVQRWKKFVRDSALKNDVPPM
ncbi:unnamed protein product [Amaranthus hypochondriacus]